MLKNGWTILFQGDSVTDAHRRDAGIGELGMGYPMMAASLLTARMPELGLQFINRGISGDRSRDLVRRWDEDCIALRPDVVTVLIGVNDTWRRFDSGDPTPAADYAANCRNIFGRTKAMGARLIVLEPFVLPINADRASWREDLDEKVGELRALAREFADAYVPLGGLFAAASVQQPMEVWAADGVHPTKAGHALIADALIDVLVK